MKLYCVEIDGLIKAGVGLDDTSLYIIKNKIEKGAEPLLSVIDAIGSIEKEIESVAEKFKHDPDKYLQERSVVPLAGVKIIRPVLNPSKIAAVGMNYMDHCIEQKVEPPERPILFTKFPSSLCNPGDEIVWDPALTNKVDFEAELAVVIGRKAYRVHREDAFRYIAGYTCLNDVSARDLQFSDGQWIRGKSIDTFCPLGPCLVTREEIPDPQKLKIQCKVNGELLQDSSTDKMIFPVAELIEFITMGITLYPGDIIATGTPHGVGVFRDPKIFLQPGDDVEVSIENIGILRNKVGRFVPEEMVQKQQGQ